MTIDLGLNRPGPVLHFSFYGTRGSTPVPHSDFLQFGGNTTCIAMTSPDLPEAVGIVDAGTGIRDLGKALAESEDYAQLKRITVVFTHFHWDHIQGFPFFDPAYDKNIQMNVMAMGVSRDFKDLRQVFSDQMQERYFPVKLEDMGADMQFLYPDKDTSILNAAKLSVVEQRHPGGSWGYRIDMGGRAVVVCTDIEHGEELDENIIHFARGADLLIHDAQYTEDELRKHRGWGHSSYKQAMEVAHRAGVRYLAMTHHDPDHDDDFLKAREQECREVMPNCILAREGMTIIV